ncbi:hypothetical protein ACP4OV_028210 [Aristida adscensionis]
MALKKERVDVDAALDDAMAKLEEQGKTINGMVNEIGRARRFALQKEAENAVLSLRVRRLEKLNECSMYGSECGLYRLYGRSDVIQVIV